MRFPLPPSDTVFGDYLVFVDESGDHGLENVPPEYPVFVLLFAVFAKDDYAGPACRDLQRIKFEFWGHDEVILHEHDLRKSLDAFRILRNSEVRARFFSRLNAYLDALPVTAVAVVVDKLAFAQQRHPDQVNLYHDALQAGLELVATHLAGLGQGERTTPVIVECRGRHEDTDLELAFRRVTDGHNTLGYPLPFHLVMVPKASNSAGLQIADLMARPVGLHYLRPGQPNRAFNLLAPKLRRGPDGGGFPGWGLKVLP